MGVRQKAWCILEDNTGQDHGAADGRVNVSMQWVFGLAVALGVCTSMAAAQDTTARGSARGIPRFPLESSGLSVRGPVRPWAYLGDPGQRAAVLGREAGSFEVWTWPLRLVRDLHLVFHIQDQAEPIEGATIARQVVVRPEGSTIVYSHPSFTVRQHVLVPLHEPGALLLLQVESTRPLSVTVRLRADFNLFWPGGFGGGSLTWQPERRRFLLTQGGARLYRALIGSPLASQGAAQSIQDAPHTPSQFVLEVNPAVAVTDYIPIVIAGGSTAADSVERVYNRLLTQAPAYWREKVAHYRRVQDDQLSIRTADARLDQALDWTKVDLDQQLRGLAAINALALTTVGQVERVRSELRLLGQQQRADGRIPYDVAGVTRLPRLPGDQRFWFGDDATSFWILACYNYWSATGDDILIRELWPNLVKAFRRRAATSGQQSDIFQTGTWLAALENVPALAAAAGDAALAGEAASLFEASQRNLEDRFWLEATGIYASVLAQNRLQEARPVLPVGVAGRDALTIWPVVAMAFGLLDNARASRMLREVGSAALTADWGTRALSSHDPLYDPDQPERGAVWPFTTGFAALAHYRYHRGWAGYDLVRDLARTTLDFARGRAPDVLSGAFYTVLEPAMPRQFSATPMLVAPVVNGLFGVQVDARNRALSVEPHLPAEWTAATLSQVRVGRERVRVDIRRERGRYVMTLRRNGSAAPLFVRLAPALPLGTRVERVRVNDSDAPIQVEETEHDVHAVVELILAAEAEVEIEYSGGLEVYAPPEPLEVGDRPDALKVLDFRREGSDFVVLVEGLPATSYTLELRVESRVRTVVGADLLEHAEDRMQLRVRFSAGVTPFARREIRIRTDR